MSKYPWADWLDGRVWLIVRGADFTCQPETMRSGAHSHAARMGVSVATHIILMPGVRDRNAMHGVLIQAFDTNGTWRPFLSRVDRSKLYDKHVMANLR